MAQGPRRDHVLAWLRLVLAGLTILALTIGLCPPGCSSPLESAVEPRLETEIEAEAGRDLSQQIEQIQQTLSRVEQNQNTQNDQIASQIDTVEALNQNIQKTMYGTSPEDAAIVIEKNRENAVIFGGGVLLVVGLLLLAFGHGVAAGGLLMIIGFIVIGLGAAGILLSLFLL